VSRIPGIFVSVSGYMRELIAPFSLHMGHEYRLFGMANAAAITGLAIVIVSAICFFLARRKTPLISFAIGWFFIALAPVSNLYPISFYMSDHYMYLPAIGFFLILAWALRKAYDKKALKIYALAALVLLTAFYSVRTIQQNRYWKDAITFYIRTLEYAPNSTRVLNNLAGRYLLRGDLINAEEMYKRVIEVDPNFMLAYYNLAIISFKKGNNEEAVRRCEAAIGLDPRYAPAYNELGLVYWAMGRKDDAIAAYNKSIDVSADNPRAMYNLALALNSLGRREEAIGLLKKAIAIKPDYAGAMNDLAVLCFQSGRSEQAFELLKRVMVIAPDYPVAYANLGRMYLETGKKKEAVELLKKALELDPGNKQLQEILGAEKKGGVDGR
jgi:tetratricopeptide (TPR) repeat protein